VFRTAVLGIIVTVALCVSEKKVLVVGIDVCSVVDDVVTIDVQEIAQRNFGSSR
jgi:hypothetical protein